MADEKDAEKSEKRGRDTGKFLWPDKIPANFAMMAILALIGSSGGGWIGGAAARADQQALTSTLGEIRDGQKRAAENAEALKQSVNDLRAEFAVIRAADLDKRLRDLERVVAGMEGRK